MKSADEKAAFLIGVMTCASIFDEDGGALEKSAALFVEAQAAAWRIPVPNPRPWIAEIIKRFAHS
jgi:hypothetical protein